ncbi:MULTISPECIES: DUF2007 domain-containing protein [Reichenbachiella]|uniref:Putative signal transducing protein n=1 Tax=Reichenbachiella agariperforans TaxID=156994 RepID=A0A1M6P406_REIAG|nr:MULTISPECIES: DUF2007 domain-containing protein [Reichenbachiella]MBU2914680.1 hypothetical protein [Reichenbachiella agariperforans]RJE71603.1 hypothetical protein BGP76_05800 [Reichenbachiella sp. MSK19-1]SHK02640.1 Putative signal transducing protein [Reichenbachiella agariperforans]
MSEWQKVYSDKNEYRANIVVAVLEDLGLQPVLVNKQDAAYHLGQFEVHVTADYVMRAIKIIKDDINFE